MFNYVFVCMFVRVCLCVCLSDSDVCVYYVCVLVYLLAQMSSTICFLYTPNSQPSFLVWWHKILRVNTVDWYLFAALRLVASLRCVAC